MLLTTLLAGGNSWRYNASLFHSWREIAISGSTAARGWPACRSDNERNGRAGVLETTARSVPEQGQLLGGRSRQWVVNEVEASSRPASAHKSLQAEACAEQASSEKSLGAWVFSDGSRLADCEVWGDAAKARDRGAAIE